jgi:hypothetical protein
MDMDPDAKVCTVRQAVDRLFSYELLPLPPRAQDGVSMIDVARSVARVRGSASVLRNVDATWKGAAIRTTGLERIAWSGGQVDTVRVEIAITSRSSAGVVGVIRLWISADERAIPYRARMDAAVGSITLELMPEERVHEGVG